MPSKDVTRSRRALENRAIYRLAPWAVAMQLVMVVLLPDFADYSSASPAAKGWLVLIIVTSLVWLFMHYRFTRSDLHLQGSRRWIRRHRLFATLTTLLWAGAPLIFVSEPVAAIDSALLLLLIAAATQLPLHLYSGRYGMAGTAALPVMLTFTLAPSAPSLAIATAIYGALLLLLYHHLRPQLLRNIDLECENRKLHAAQEKTRTFFSHACHLTGIAYWELDLKSGALAWSDDAYALFGLPAGTPLTGPTVMGAIYWHDRNLYQRTLREALSGKALLNREFRVIHPDGSVHVLRDSGEIVTNPEGERHLMLGVMHDITGQVAAEEKLRATYGEISRILDHMQDTYYRADPSGRLAMVSPSIGKLLGYSPEMCVGKRIAELYSSTRHGQSFLHDLNTQGGTLRNYQIQMSHSDGRTIWVSVNAQFIRNERDKVIGIEGTMRDVTQLRQAEQALHKERERALITLHSIADGVITTNSEGRIQYLNPTAERLLGVESTAATGRPYLDIMRLVNDESGEPLGDMVKHCIHYQEHGSHNHEGLLENPQGERYHLHIHVAPMRDTLGHIIGAVLVIHDVTEVMGMAKQLNYQANHDTLTGLFNRRAFEKRVTEAIQHAQQRNEAHALFYIDLDQFKVVNDTCGHMAGDELLQQVAQLMQQQVRDADVLARLGGDEFGVLLEYCPVDKAAKIAESIRATIRDYRFGWEGKSFEIGASIGLVPIVAASGNLSDVLAAADAACYVAKDSGRNRTHIYQPDDAAVVKRHGEMEWVHRLSHAFDEERFLLYAQAVAHVAGDRVVSHYEILLRMTDEHGRVVPPGAFIPAAERYNLMPTIDRWVIRKTLEMMREAQGDLVFPPVECAINLSGQSLCDEQFLEYVVDLFEETEVPCESVCFEITETAAVANLTRATSFITVLKNMGCSFALDDFGAGLSSFGYLKRLPIDYLKIDGSFVRDMVVDQVDRAMVESINQIGHVMHLKTIGEFAEDEAVLLALERAGVDYAQGLAIAPPLPLREVLEREARQLHRGSSETNDAAISDASG